MQGRKTRELRRESERVHVDGSVKSIEAGAERTSYDCLRRTVISILLLDRINL